MQGTLVRDVRAVRASAGTGSNETAAMPAFVLTMPPGAMNRPLGVYSTFLPARGAQLSVNGGAATAKVFMQDRFGRPASSCCLAWSETWTKPRE